MAYWGVAMDYLGNTLATTPTRAEAQAAWDALEKARAVGPKTQRERDWIDALSAYFRDHDKVPVNTRLAPTTPRWNGWRRAIRTPTRCRPNMR
jgi:hypothetical protein